MSSDKGSARTIPTALRSMQSLQHKIYDTAYLKGWYEEHRTFGDRIALMHSELSEALEEFRNGHPVSEIYYVHAEDCDLKTRRYVPCVRCAQSGVGACDDAPHQPTCSCDPKPEGVPIELADCVIRILDFACSENIDLGDAIWEKMIYNENRPHRHGGKAL